MIPCACWVADPVAKILPVLEFRTTSVSVRANATRDSYGQALHKCRGGLQNPTAQASCFIQARLLACVTRCRSTVQFRLVGPAILQAVSQ
jgi:hypothetical protein